MTHKAATEMDGDAQAHLPRSADARQRKAIRQGALKGRVPCHANRPIH